MSQDFGAPLPKKILLKKIGRAALYLGAALIGIFIGTRIVIGAAYDWNLTTAGDYVNSDATKIELATNSAAQTVARLRVVQTYSDENSTNFTDNGTYTDAGYVTDHIELGKFTPAAQSAENSQTPAPFDVNSATLTEIAFLRLDEADTTTTMADSANDGGFADNFTRTIAGDAAHPLTFAHAGGAFPANLPTTFTNGIQFDGGDRLYNTDNASSPFSNTYSQRTYSVWFKSSAGVAANAVIWEVERAAVDGGTSIWLSDSGVAGQDNVNCQFWSQGGDTVGVDMNKAAMAPFTHGAWHHLVCVFTGAAGTSKMYLDGKESSTITLGSVNGTAFTNMNGMSGTPGWDSITPMSTRPETIGNNVGTTTWCGNVTCATSGAGLPATTFLDEVIAFSTILSHDDALSLYGLTFTKPGLWHLNESSGDFLDSSGTNFRGTATGVTYDAAGKFSRCVSLAGSAYITLATASGNTSSFYAVPSTADAFTLEAWIDPTTLPSGGATQVLIDTNPTGGLYQLSITTDSVTGRTVLQAKSSNTTPNTLVGDIGLSDVSTAGPQGDGWQHVAAVWNYGSWYLYVNGQLDTSTEYTGTVNSGNTGIRIGADAGASSGYIGKIDEVVVSTRARSAEEIARDAGNFKAVGTYTITVSKDSTTAQAWKLKWDEATRYRDATETNYPGLVHLYKLEDNTDAMGAINLTLTGTNTVRGMFGNAQYADTAGTDTIVMSSPLAASYSAYTFATWFRFQSPTSNTTDNDLILRVGTNNPAIRRKGSGAVNMGYIEALASGSPVITSKKVVRDTLWHHVAITLSGGTMTLYVDGQSQGTAGSIAASEAATMSLGNRVGSNTFQGAIDEASVYNRALSATEILNLYNRGIVQLHFLAKTCDDLACDTEPWSGPGGANQVAPSVTAGVVAMWNFDEATWSGTFADDISTAGCTGACDGWPLNYADTAHDTLFPAASSRSGDFNGTDMGIWVADDTNLEPAALSLEAWVKMDEGQKDNAVIIEKEYATTNDVVSYSLQITVDHKLRLRLNDSGVDSSLTSTNPGEMPVGEWVHLVGVYDNARTPKAELYINGVSVGSDNTTRTISYDTGDLVIGASGDGGGTWPAFRGKIDMIKIYNAALATATVLSRYNEGAISNYYEAGGGQSTGLTSQRYFRYKAFLRGNYGRSPQLQKVFSTGPNVYDTSNPTIDAAAATGLQYSSLNSFTLSAGLLQDAAAAPKFNLKCQNDVLVCSDSTNWKYYNTTVTPDAASGWQTSTGVATTNTIAELTAARLALFDDAVGGGKIIWRAYLPSDGSAAYEIDNINIDATYNPESLTVNRPSAQASLLVGGTVTVSWKATGPLATGGTVDLEYSPDGASWGSLSPATATANAQTGGCTLVGDDTGCANATIPATNPNAISTVFRVRVSDNDVDNFPVNTSPADNTVKGDISSFALSSSPWKVESSKDTSDVDIDIRWNYEGQIGNVSLTFDKDGDFNPADTGDDLHTDGNIISGLAPNNSTGCSLGANEGCYRWTAGPDANKISTTAAIRIVSTTAPTTTKDTATFSTVGWYDLTSPTGTSKWFTGETTRTINWETHGNGIGNVDLDYKIDTGAWTAIAGYQNQADGDGLHSHTWASVIDAQCATLSTTGGGGCDKVQIRVENTAATYSTTSPNFTIKPRILNIAPNNDADSGTPTNFKIGDTARTISWTYDGTVNGGVNVYYSTDQNWGGVCSGGTGKCSVCSVTAPTATCSWAAVPTITPDWSVAFQVEAANDTTDVLTTSGATYAIHGKWGFTAPLASSENYPEEQLTVTWTENTAATISNVNLWYKVGSSGWTLLNGGGAMTEGEVGNYNGVGTNDNGPWTIPADFIHDSVQLRVADANDPNCPSGVCYSAGTATFKSVLKPRLINPTGVTWKVGQKQDIRWAYKGDTATVTNAVIKYCLDGTITCVSPTTLVASVAANNSPADCTAPAGGELNAGETGGCIEWDENIDATTTGVGNIRDLEGRLFIQDANNQACSPNACAGGRPVISTVNSFIGSAANVKLVPNLAFVGIVPATSGQIPVTPYPTDSSQLDAGRDYKIRWDSQGTPLATVNLWYAFDGGAFSNSIPASQSPPGSNPVANTTAATPPVSPNNDYAYWRTPNAAASLSLTTPARQYVVRVEDPDAAFDQDVYVDSGTYKVVAWFNNLRDGADVALSATTYCKVQGTCTVKWDSNPADVANVKVQYSLDGGAGWSDASATIANSGTYSWTVNNVAGIIGNDTQVRVVDMDASRVQRTDPLPSANFNVVPNIVVTTPPLGAGLHWRETQVKAIHWKMIGDLATVTNVGIEYSTDADANAATFDNPQSIVASTPNDSDTTGPDTCTKNTPGAGETTGCYAWPIPDNADFPDTTVYIRVKDVDGGHPDSTQISGNGVSSVVAIEQIEALTVINVSPFSESLYYPSNQMDVKWTGTGLLATDPTKSVEILWSTNDFGGSTIIGTTYDADSATNGCDKTGYTGCARVTIPDAISTNFKVRVREATDAEILIDSGALTVEGKVTVSTNAVSSQLVVKKTFDIFWTVWGSIDASNDTMVELDSVYAGSNFLNPGLTTYGTTYTNSANGACTPPDVSAFPGRVSGCLRVSGGVPDEITNDLDANVRVTDGTTNAKNGTSGTFRVTGALTLKEPQVNDVWKVETALDINDAAIYVGWTYNGGAATLGNVRITFDRDGDFSAGDTGFDLHTNGNVNSSVAVNAAVGCTAPTPASDETGGGCYVWSSGPAADYLSSGAVAKFRVETFAATPNPVVQSDLTATPNFEVRGWYLMVQPPEGTAVWYVGETSREIRWETHGTGMGNIDLQYNVNNTGWAGNDITTNRADVDSGAGSAYNSFTWPSVVNAGCATLNTTGGGGCDKVKIRVKQTGAGTFNSESSNFTIKPKITLTDPQADPSYQIGATASAIAGTYTGTMVGNINLFYSTDAAWGSACTSATGAGKCTACTATPSAGTFSCNFVGSGSSVPNTPSVSVKFRAEAVNDTAMLSTTTNNARIHGLFTMNLPACTSGDCFSEDTTNLSWTQTAGDAISIPNVRVEYYTGGSWLPVIASTANDGNYNGGLPPDDADGPWLIPETLVTDAAKVRVYDVNDTALDSKGESTAFPVKAKFRMITPNGSEKWKIGDATKEIQWAFQGPTTGMTVNVKFCADGTIGCASPGSIASNIAANYSTGCTLPTGLGTYENGGCFDWIDGTTGGVANTRDTDIRVFVQDNETNCAPVAACGTARPKKDDGSDSNFIIMIKLAENTPTTNQELDANTVYTIRWTSQGTPLTTADLVLSDNGGTSFGTNIQLAEPNTSVAGSATLNTYSGTWTTPLLISDTGIPRTYVLRVRDPDTTNYLDAKADVPVKVVAKFDFTAPTSSDAFKIGDLVSVAVTKKGSLVNAIHKFFTIDRGSYSAIVQDGTGGTTLTDATGERAYISTFVWKVPDVTGMISNDVRVQVSDGDDTHVLRTTLDETQSFKVVANLAMIKPDGTETGANAIKAGYNFNIQWKSVGTTAMPATVDLQYSTNDFSGACVPATGAGVCTIATDITHGSNTSTWGSCTLPSVGSDESGGCYSYKVHKDLIFPSIKFRVIDSDAGHPASTLVAGNGVSPAFAIVKSLKLLNPNGGGGQQLTNGAVYQVQWETYGSFASGALDIEYGTDAELANPIPSDPPSDVILNRGFNDVTGCTAPGAPDQGGAVGCYAFTVPNDLRSSLRVRLYEDVSPNTQDSSDSTFEIVGPLAMVVPNGGGSQYYKVDDTPVYIRWDNNDALPRESPVDLEYSTNGFSGACVAATGAGACQVLDSTPVAAEGLDNTDTSPYRNTSCGADGGADSICWQFPWKIPDTISDTVTVRVIKQNTPTTGDASNANFKIIGKLTLTTLTSADAVWTFPMNFPTDGIAISWNRVGTAQAGSLFDDFEIHYSTTYNGSDPATFDAGATTLDGSVTLAEAGCSGGDLVCDGFKWDAPDTHTVTSTATRYIRVRDPSQTEGAVISPFKFELAGKLNLTSFGSNQTLIVGSNIAITWDKEGLASGSVFDAVDLQYSNDNFSVDFRTIDVAAGGALVINGGGSVCTGANCTKTGGWTIPTTATLTSGIDYWLRVIDPDNTDSKSISAGKFKLRGDLLWDQANSPTVATKWIVGTEPNLAWRTVGNITGVKLSYSTNSFTNETFFKLNAGKLVLDTATTFASALSITNTANNTQTYPIVVPDVNSAAFQLRLYDANDTSSTADVNFPKKDSAVFKVHPKFTFISPTPGFTASEIKYATNTATISWTLQGTVSAAKFEYTMDDSNWVPIPAAQSGSQTNDSGIAQFNVNSTTSMTWTLPNAKSDISVGPYKAKVRVSYYDGASTDSDTTATSPNAFKIAAKVTVSAPTGEQNPLWKVGETGKLISWTTAPTDLDGGTPGNGNVKLFYKVGVASPVQIGSATANDGSENWTPSIPNAVNDASTVIIIEDDLDSDGKAQSAAPFSIAGNLTAIAVKDPDTLAATTELYVYEASPASLAKSPIFEWTSSGSAMTRVLLQYSSNSFGSPASSGTEGEPDADVNCTLQTGKGSCPIATITNNVEGLNSYTTWQLPDKIGTGYKIRVVNDTANTPGKFGTSPLIESQSGNVSFLARFVFTSHNATTDKCLLGVNCNLTWVNSGTVSNVLLEHATTGSNWAYMNSGNPISNASKSYNWPTPSSLTGAPSNTTLYRIRDNSGVNPVDANLEKTDASSKILAYFNPANIKLDITTDPGQSVVGGQTFKVNDVIKVNYTYTGSVTAIDVQYTLDTDADPTTFDNPVTLGAGTGLTHPIPPSGGTGQFQWVVQDLLAGGANTTRIQFRILDSAAGKEDNATSNVTNGVTGSFKIAGKITIDAPILGTERWQVGTSVPITITTTGSITSVSLYYDIYDNVGTFLATTQIPGGPFTVGANTQTSTNFTVNTTNFTDLDSRPLYYKRLIIKAADAAGEGGSPTHGAFSVAVVKPIKIIGKLSLAEASSLPQAGAKWPVGSPQTVTWTTFGKVPSVKLYYDDDGLFNGNEVEIVSSCGSPVTNTQGTNTTGANTSCSYTPPVTLPLTSTYKLRLVDQGDNTTPDALTYQLTSGTSSQDTGAFTIHGFVDTVVLTTANGTVKHKASDSATITWNTTGNNLNTVDVKFRDTAGTPCYAGAWQNISVPHDNTAGNRGTKSWTIPETCNSSAIEVRVIPRIPNDGTDTNAGYDFVGSRKFMPKITVGTIPNSGQLKIGTAYDITWTISGIISSMRIRYKPSDAVGYANDAPPIHYVIANSINPNNSPYALQGANAKVSWQDVETAGVEDTPTAGSTAKIKIENLDDVTGDADAESALFSIEGFFNVSTFTYKSLSVGADAEFEVYHATLNNNKVTINWNGGGTIPNAIIEYSNSYDGSNPATFNAGRKCLDKTVVFPCATVANWTGSTGSKTYDWSVPDDISRGSSPYYIRVSDPNNANVYDIFPDGASNGVKIKSAFTLSKPDGTQEWLVGTPTYTVEWKHTGTVATVLVEYSAQGNWVHEDTNSNGLLDGGEDLDADGYLDVIGCIGGGTYPSCTAVTNVNQLNGTNTYNWQIADNDKMIPYKCVNTSFYPDSDKFDSIHPCKITTAKVRVRDAGDIVVSADSALFTARYATKKFYLRNAVTGADLDSVTMAENTIHKVRAYLGQNLTGLVSPFVIPNPAGVTYSITFQKTGFTDFVDTAQTSTMTDQVTSTTTVVPSGSELVISNPSPNPPHPDGMLDEFQLIFLSDIVAHNDVIVQNCTYFAAVSGGSSSLVCDLYYTRDGLTVVTTTEGNLIIDNGGTNVYNQTTTTQTPAASGIYRFSITNPTLTKGVIYTLRSRVKLPTGTYLQGTATYSIDAQSESKTTDTNVAVITPIITTNIDAKLSDVRADIAAAKSSIEGKVDTTKTSLETKMDSQTTIIQTKIDEFVTKSDDAIYKMQDEITKGAIRLIAPENVKIGTTATLRVSTAPSIVPTVDALCPNGTAIFTAKPLTATTTVGIYAVDVKFDAVTFKCAIAQAVTVIANATIPSKDPNDPAFLATAVTRIGLTASTLDDVLAAASSGMNAEKAAKDAKDAIKNVEKALTGDGNIMSALDNLQKNVSNLPKLIGSSQSGMTQVKSTIEEVSTKLNTFIGKEGYDMRTILKQEIGEGVKGVRNKVDRTLVATSVMKEIVERKVGKSDEPIIQQFYEIGSVKLRVVAVNPSKEKSQVVPIKIYLPKEVIPDDIIEMKDLKVGYDSEKSLYYAYTDSAELAPSETRVFEVHLEDVWRVPENEITEIREQTNRALKHLEKTEYFDRAKVIVDSIDKRINDILAKQNDDSVSREEHIGAYRTNLVVMEDVKKDIAKLEKILMHTGAPPSIELLKDTVFEEKDALDRITAWKLILAIIGFLGLLGAGFYLRWFLLVRNKRNLRMELLEDAPLVGEHVEGSGGAAAKEKKHEIEEIDIEKFLESDQKNKRKAG